MSVGVPPPSKPLVLFDASHRPLFTVAAGLKRLRRQLAARYRLAVCKEALTPDVLRQAALVIIVGPRERYSRGNLSMLRAYLHGGGSILIALGEGGEPAFGTNINAFTEEHGLAFRSDTVLRTVPFQHYHPKEVHLGPDAILRKELNAAAGKKAPLGGAGGGGDLRRAPLTPIASRRTARHVASPATSGITSGIPVVTASSPRADLALVYPYGCTLAVSKPAFSLLSSGAIGLPVNRPLCALATARGAKPPSRAPPGPAAGPAGRLCLLGSSHFLHDEWLGKEENAALVEVTTPRSRRDRGSL